MNYRHAFHAGNFADVIKHVALVAILLHLRKKPTGFAVIDTHAGRGLYDLKSDEASRTSESSFGIGRLADVTDAPDVLKSYLELAASAGTDRYPGSPLIEARLLRDSDRLVAIEKHPEEAAALKNVLAFHRRARVVDGDGYAVLPSLLPPPERRGLIVIDPPYEKESEFLDAARALDAVHRRFATGICLLWFPIKSSADADLLCGEILTSGVDKLSRIDIDLGPSSNDGALSAAGLLIVNPPFGFDEEMWRCAEILAPRLGRSGTPASISVTRLVG